MPRPERIDFRPLHWVSRGGASPRRGRCSPIAALVLAAVACSSPPPSAPAIDREAVCARSRDALDESRHLVEQGYLGRAAPLAERADRDCSTADTRLHLAEVWAGLGLDHLAAEAYRRYAAGGDAAASELARTRIAALRPPTLHPRAMVEAGLAARRAGREADARATYARALAVAESRARTAARPLRMHQSVDVVTAAFHPAGGYLATVDRTGAVELWDLERARVARVFDHPGATRVRFSPSGAVLATAGGARVRLWQLTTSARLRELALPATITDLAYSADGTHLAMVAADRVRLFRTDTGARVLERALARGGGPVAVSPTGALIAVAGDRFVQVIDAAGVRAPVVFAGHRAPVTALAFDPTGALVLSGARDGSVRMSDAASGTERLGHGNHRAAVIAVGVRGSTGHMVSVAADGSAQLWSLAATSNSYAVTVADAGRVVAADPGLRSALSVASDSLVQWSFDGGKELRRLRGRGPAMVTLALAPDGRYLVTGDAAGDVRRWDLTTGARSLLDGHTGAVRALAFSADGAWLASGGDDGTVRVWDMGTGREHQLFDPQRGAITAVGFDGDAAIVVGRHGAGATAWDRRSNQPVAVPARAALVDAAMTAVAGELAARGSVDASVTLARSGTAMAELYAAADGTWLVIAADGRVDGATGAQAYLVWQAGDVQLPGFVGWQRQHVDGLLPLLTQRPGQLGLERQSRDQDEGPAP